MASLPFNRTRTQVLGFVTVVLVFLAFYLLPRQLGAPSSPGIYALDAATVPVVRASSKRASSAHSLSRDIDKEPQWLRGINYGVVMMEPRLREAFLWVIRDTLNKVPTSWKVRTVVS